MSTNSAFFAGSLHCSRAHSRGDARGVAAWRSRGSLGGRTSDPVGGRGRFAGLEARLMWARMGGERPKEVLESMESGSTAGRSSIEYFERKSVTRVERGKRRNGFR